MKKILIVEDEFIVAHDLSVILSNAGYHVTGIADSVKRALAMLEQEPADLVLLDIYLKGKLTGIDLARTLMKLEIPFIYVSANSNEKVMEAVKPTLPYGFIIKPYREKDVLLSIDIASYRSNHSRSMKADTKVHQAGFSDMIGGSPALHKLQDQLMAVAPTDTAVLITGESGTGKEIIARHLHRLSGRSKEQMIAVNCAALPAELIESILFGHEKGAFTDAVQTKIGKFEEASGGTLFLDEIGEMPFDLQAKLLRVLQEQEIERVGGSRPIPVDLRIIAATNLQLEREIARGRFRLDLFYRLNVFPLQVPSLRERRTDIPLLVAHFIQKHATKAGRQIDGTTDGFMAQLMRYDWPGNIRELEHVLLRSILLSRTGMLEEGLLELKLDDVSGESPAVVKTIAENERDHIVEVLQRCKWKIAGAGGAADLLGIPPTTLNSKMRKLGIRR
ncbi:two component, sigma54 specific, transcriptional regulator, Fis family protein [Pedobacter sp. BAL39]|uniref:sigma-54-dependent transcriptional regulator n=1 Tax=Pedobacter sp. BAL39 TaxID=391596 RepID=UPI0001559570|nr:sigma-54 dependent transcriptional regulator [Pedobacter sp. BAL39]EDM35206.1 two component, sigma54 specific, transcriptional regulator, Fis family protein [Pedobacter sp. BAL39]